MSTNTREAILAAARLAAQSHGYNGLNFRDLAAGLGIKSASIHYHFATKADLGAAVARRYWEDTAAALEDISAETPDAAAALHRYPEVFRRSLEQDNRLCLGSFMATEYEDLPDAVKTEVLALSDVMVAWLARTMTAAGVARTGPVEQQAYAVFAAVAGAQLMARSRADIALFDALVEGYRASGLLPA